MGIMRTTFNISSTTGPLTVDIGVPLVVGIVPNIVHNQKLFSG